MHYPADPPSPEEVVSVMRQAGPSRHGLRIRALIAVLWRAGLRIQEALDLSESDIDPHRGSVLVMAGKGDRRRESGMDRWRLERVAEWSAVRASLPVGPLFCVIDGASRGQGWS